MQVVYTKEAFPTEVTKSLFLAGPTPRDTETPSWRPEALKLLEGLGYDGTVFVPENRGGKVFGDYIDQVEWEEKALSRADAVVFWVPREMSKMPALTTNCEWGMWADSGKAILGAPVGAASVRYLQTMATKLKVPSYSTLDAALEEAVRTLGAGSLRTGGEVEVPLQVWNHPTFQKWYGAQKKAGNRLDSARVLWTFRVGRQRDRVFCWALHVDVWIASEKRSKVNEFVIGRNDVSTVALFYRPTYGGSLEESMDAEFLLVREFRSPARTPTGFILELPGGSAKDSPDATLEVALSELEEETTLKLEPDRVYPVKELQLAGTLSAHTGQLFAGVLRKREWEELKALAKSGKTFGVEADTERTYVEIRSVREVLEKGLVDWSTLGMMLTALATEGA